jgi:lactate dehydrogenase-like 2-hydroxyacid dehydrogenase
MIQFDAARKEERRRETPMIHFLIHDASDNVGVAVVDIAAGSNCAGRNLTNNESLKARSEEAIPLGHKIALKDFAVGDTAIKYGCEIGTIVLLNAKYFGRMKSTATFINTSRGEVVVENDLLDALKSGRIAGAALDVRVTEPPLTGELERLPNLILTPHVAAFTREAQDG